MAITSDEGQSNTTKGNEKKSTREGYAAREPRQLERGAESPPNMVLEPRGR